MPEKLYIRRLAVKAMPKLVTTQGQGAGILLFTIVITHVRWTNSHTNHLMMYYNKFNNPGRPHQPLGKLKTAWATERYTNGTDCLIVMIAQWLIVLSGSLACQKKATNNKFIHPKSWSYMPFCVRTCLHLSMKDIHPRSNKSCLLNRKILFQVDDFLIELLPATNLIWVRILKDAACLDQSSGPKNPPWNLLTKLHSEYTPGSLNMVTVGRW